VKNNTEKIQRIESSDDAWESGKLGRDEKYAVADEQVTTEMDDDLGLQMISIRLSKDLINSFKLLGHKYGMGYQPLMREALKRFADGELKIIAKEILEEQSRSLKTSKEKSKKAA
jgi:uncharacterized protein (DUF4415 family)